MHTRLSINVLIEIPKTFRSVFVYTERTSRQSLQTHRAKWFRFGNLRNVPILLVLLRAFRLEIDESASDRAAKFAVRPKRRRNVLERVTRHVRTKFYREKTRFPRKIVGKFTAKSSIIRIDTSHHFRRIFQRILDARCPNDIATSKTLMWHINYSYKKHYTGNFMKSFLLIILKYLYMHYNIKHVKNYKFFFQLNQVC